MNNGQMKKATDDILGSIFSYHLWMTLGWQDIRQRYRRSLLGPWWITLSLSVTVLAMGLLYSKLFHQEIKTYLPFLAVGMVFWNLLSALIIDSTNVFINAEGIIKQIPMNFGIHVLRMVWRNVIIFFHNMLVVIVSLAIFGVRPGLNILLFPIVVLFIMSFGYGMGILLGILGTRFRDIGQMIMSIVQILFFVTPVMWSPNSIAHKIWIIEYNPLYYVFSIARNSLSGGTVPVQSWEIVFGMTVLLWFLAYRMLVRYRSRIAYWL